VARRILIIDDEADIRAIARLSLEKVGGYEVVDAAGGAAGVDAAVAAPPDAILLDVMMPGQDGPATLDALRARPETAHIPVVFLTAKAQQADREALLAQGAAGVLVKPFNPMALPAQLASVVGWE
jgi:CheY-like chemotaxis protein